MALRHVRTSIERLADQIDGLYDDRQGRIGDNVAALPPRAGT
jgi:hypothetical protein